MPFNVTVPAPRVALCNSNTTFTWSDGVTKFNGYVLIELIPPSNGSTPWTDMNYGNLSPSITLPVMQRIPILYGQLNSACGVYLTQDITPPNSWYIAWYYDATDRQIAGPTAQFQVTTQDAFTPPILVLTAPTTPGTPVQPD